jgi:hypothetical protein
MDYVNAQLVSIAEGGPMSTAVEKAYESVRQITETTPCFATCMPFYVSGDGSTAAFPPRRTYALTSVAAVLSDAAAH